ncbi:MAG: alpha-amylase family glycosyl hydrolase, partial [Actinomycetota bacterium]|nr:alpha-amylase family glycosyl hydrolase [Actinomycetota bacterium]
MSDLRATYRLQLRPGFGFRQARELVPYLQELGISHLYLSPSLQARAGSTHGYDVVDPTRISEELGGEDEFRALCSAGLGVVLDIVPNHMAATGENPFWRDPLWRAKFFDLDWRTGSHRRFFDVGELAGVRMEDPEVWEVTHAKVVELAQDGLIDGVRVDHPDGLSNPRRYLERLREAGVPRVWVEKILEPGERLPADWPVEGTTGYEFMNDVTALFVDQAAEEPLTRLYEELTGERRPFAELAAEAKLEQAATTFSEETAQLAAKLPFELDIPRALAALHVYRTYVEPDVGEVTDADRAAIAGAGLPDELARILTLEKRGHDAFVVRFQQTTPPVHAKGVEDTAFYRWNRFVALNEVGGDPSRFSLSVAAFHAANAARPPGNLLATTTHDTKRSGDVRARLAAITEDPAGWEALVRPRLGGWRDPNEAYLILQTVVGAWPL